MEPRLLLAAELAVELNPNPASLGGAVLGFVRAGDRVFYGANDGVHGGEVWSSDGTAAGTLMVADLTPGERGSEIPAMASAGGLAYFVRLANQLPNPFASTLYRSDGTAAGTFAMPSPGAAVSVPVEAIGKAFYVAGPAGSVGLYETDGTVAGTRVLRPGAATMAGTPTALFYETDGTLYRYDGNATTVLRTGTPIRLMTAAPGYLLIQQDGLNYFQIVDTTTGELSSIPAATSTGFRYTVLGDRIVFEAAGQPWLTDGTVAGTQPIVPSGGGSFAHPGESIEVGGTVYFTAELAGAQSPGGELFKLTAGAPGATLVADIMPGPFGSFPRGFTAYQGRLYFMASDPEHGEELWSTDGTEDGTRLELDAHPGPASSGSQFQVLGDRLLFIGDAALSGRELYQLDPGAGPNGTSGYHLVYDTNAQGAGAAFGSTPFPAAAVMGGRMFFAADDFNARGMEPWVSDGTPAGTRPIKDLFPGSGSSYPHLFTPYAGWVYFVAGGTGLVGEEWLWSTDGTDAGTSRVGAMHHVRTLTVAGGKLYAGTYDDGLWVVDSPDAPAREVRAAATGGRLTRVQAPAAVGDSLYFGAGEGGTSAPTQIWRTDGSAATPLTTFSDVSFINDGAAARGKYFFLRNGDLWVIDGSAARLAQGVGTEMVVLNDFVYAGGNQLWRTDGSNTSLIAPSGANLTVAGRRLFLTYREPTAPTHGVELWTSDGNPTSGARLVKDIGQSYPGGVNTGSDPGFLFEAGGALFFSADDLGNGRELWRTDGTEAGTALVRDIYDGPADANPMPLGVIGNRLYFAATDFTHGREIWSVEVAAPVPPPTVTGVHVSGSAWAPAFKETMDRTNIGSAELGFEIPTLWEQPRTLPWSNLDRISITFSGDVRVDANDLRVTGVNVARYALDAAAFSYDAATHTATWRLAGGQTFGTDRIRLDLDGDGAGDDGNDGVRTAAGTLLDGEWHDTTGGTNFIPVDGGDAFPSGDGLPGGDFRYAINVLPGDVNRNGSVLANDFADVKARFFRSIDDPGTSGPRYNLFDDLDGSGVILADDSSEVKKRFFQRLPAGQPAATASVASGATLAGFTTRTAPRPPRSDLLESDMRPLA